MSDITFQATSGKGGEFFGRRDDVFHQQLIMKRVDFVIAKFSNHFFPPFRLVNARRQIHIVVLNELE